MGAVPTALHVMDPYLKQFHSEIYAQGRREYLDHVESEIRNQSREALDEIKRLAMDRKIEMVLLSRYGDPIEEFLHEAKQGGYNLAVIGAKSPTLRNRLRSRNLPKKLCRKIAIPLLIVRE